MKTENLLTPTETGRYLLISNRQLKRWRKAKDGPRYVQFGKRTIRYRIADLEAWVTACQSKEA